MFCFTKGRYKEQNRKQSIRKNFHQKKGVYPDIDRKNSSVEKMKIRWIVGKDQL